MAKAAKERETVNYANVEGMGVVQVRFIDSAQEFKWRLEWLRGEGNEHSEWTGHYTGILAHTFSNGRTFMVLTGYWEGFFGGPRSDNPLKIERPIELISHNKKHAQPIGGV
jgi:hypothetical protein